MTGHRAGRRDPLRVSRAALLLGLAALIAKLFAAGEMVKYMAPALDPLTALTALVLAGMGAMELAGGRHRVLGAQRHADAVEPALTYVLVVLPIAVGMLVAPRALGAGALGGERVSSLLLAYAPGPAPARSDGPPAPARPITDTADLVAYLQQVGIAGAGQRVRATGLALAGQDLGGGQLALLRYAIAHCVADARPLALLVVAPPAPTAPADQWVEVEGALGVREHDGRFLVTIEADRIRPIAEPPNPYLASF